MWLCGQALVSAVSGLFHGFQIDSGWKEWISLGGGGAHGVALVFVCFAEAGRVRSGEKVRSIRCSIVKGSESPATQQARCGL